MFALIRSYFFKETAMLEEITKAELSSTKAQEIWFEAGKPRLGPEHEACVWGILGTSRAQLALKVAERQREAAEGVA